jgi:hypothetical protein
MKWTHFDQNLAASFDAGLAQMAAADWSASDVVSVKNLQAVQATRALLIASLIGTATYTTLADGRTSVDASADLTSGSGERYDAARALLAPCKVYALAAGLPPIVDQDFVTQAPEDTGLWPVAVVIACVVVGGAVVGWISHETASVIKYFKTENTQKDALARTDAAALDVIAKHTQEEQKQGKGIPFTEAERTALSMLEQRSNEMASAIQKKSDPAASALPWYVWAGAGAVGLVAVLYLTNRSGGVTVVSTSPAKAA